jgi:beta-barrel assembly-enhancing protease
VYITAALFNRLQTEAQLAGVLGHEIGHVVARHGAEHIAKTQLAQDLTGAVVVASYDPSNPNSMYAAQLAQLVGQLVNLRYGRNDEIESDRLGVRFMAQAGYDPRAMVGVMQILAESSSGGGQPEFFSTHPNPENRIQRIEEAIAEEFPDGLPQGLIQ